MKPILFSSRSSSLRLTVGVVVRMVMERLGWRKTGKKGNGSMFTFSLEKKR